MYITRKKSAEWKTTTAVKEALQTFLCRLPRNANFTKRRVKKKNEQALSGRQEIFRLQLELHPNLPFSGEAATDVGQFTARERITANASLQVLAAAIANTYGYDTPAEPSF